MEIDNIVDYSPVSSLDGYGICINTKRKWSTDVALDDVTIGREEEHHVLPVLTIDDVTAHNNEVGQRDWFKYGQRVYSVEKIKTIIQGSDERDNDAGDEDSENNPDVPKLPKPFPGIGLDRGYPVYVLRKFGLSRLELNTLLSQAVVGDLVRVDKYTQLVKFKTWVEDVLKGMNNSNNVVHESHNIIDFRDQLNRWLKDYPCVEYDRYKHPVNCVDHNDNFFPLPAQVMCNPLVLRHWSEDWETFDVTLPEGGAWEIRPLLNESIGDTHEVFVNLVQSRVDEHIDDLDMDITGEAAWDVIEDNVIKHDITTLEQDSIWRARDSRTQLRDREWMRKRRKRLANRLAERHGWTRDKIAPYLTFCDTLEQGWQTFQKLC